MKKMKYPAGAQYKQNYIKIFQAEHRKMQAMWTHFKGTYTELAAYPIDVKDFLTADFHQLTEWYIDFMRISKDKRKEINNKLKDNLFNYDEWSSKIAKYFKDPENGFNLISCIYCDMAYVNAYEVNLDIDAIFFLNNASDDDLMIKLRTTSEDALDAIHKARKFKTRADFDRVCTSLKWQSDKYDKIFIKPYNKYKHHFDLDHVLPKSKCALIALSLYNLVPCCQVCNQRLKKSEVLGTMGKPYEKLSPTSPEFDFEGQVSFHVIPKRGVRVGSLRQLTRQEDYELQLISIDPDYDLLIKIFRLQERYAHHKKKALHWIEMNYKYTDSRIAMMANALDDPSFSFKRIKSDIFQNELYESESMCFSKLREDMLK